MTHVNLHSLRVTIMNCGPHFWFGIIFKLNNTTQLFIPSWNVHNTVIREQKKKNNNPSGHLRSYTNGL